MNIPQYTNCPFCQSKMENLLINQTIRKCLTCELFSCGHNVSKSSSWIRIRLTIKDGPSLYIHGSNNWTIESGRPSNGKRLWFADLLLEGKNADDLFDINNLDATKQTAQTLLLFS